MSVVFVCVCICTMCLFVSICIFISLTAGSLSLTLLFLPFVPWLRRQLSTIRDATQGCNHHFLHHPPGGEGEALKQQPRSDASDVCLNISTTDLEIQAALH